MQSCYYRCPAVRIEQQRALELATKRYQDMAMVREAAMHQQRMIKGLELKVQEAKTRRQEDGGVSAEAELLLSKERGKRDELREAAAQLEITTRPTRPKEMHATCDEAVADQLQQRT